jgi:uncharacterized membrane protein YphA (DoxX/SURF4 family)
MPTLNSPDGGLRALSLIMGMFLVLMGTGKLAWFADSGYLTYQLEEWLSFEPVGISRWYLEWVAMPGAPLFARLVVLGELATGVALLAGFRVRLTGAVALAMVVNFQFASGIMFTSGYLTNGYGPPVIGGLAALAIGGGRRLPYSIPW